MSAMPSDIAELLGAVAPTLMATPDAGLPPAVSAVAVGGSDLALAGGAYEGAQRFDELALWQPPMNSADGDILPEKVILDARSRDILRNDAYVGGGATLHKDNIVGALFLLNAKPETKVLFGSDDEVWEREFQEEVETKFTLAAESPSHWFDVQRTKTLTALVRLAVGVYTAGGEILASAEWMPKDGRPYRSAIQMIDTDRLSTPWDRAWDRDIRGGIERDRWGAPIGYHIRNAHPGDCFSPLDFDQRSKWTRVAPRNKWGRQQILHIYEQMRPDQTRGISSMVGALSEMKMLKGHRKVELQRAVVAATYAASIESDLPTADVLQMMGGDGSNENLDAASKAMLAYLNNIDQYSGGSQNLYHDGVKVPVFMPGTRLKLQSPGNTGPLGDKFEQSLLRHISAALGVSYEQLSKDYSQTNYSSARAAMTETWKFMQSRKKIAADTTASFVYRLWLEEAINYGHLECLKRRNIPNFYEGLNADAYAACEWIGAGQGMIDPLKEGDAYARLHAGGFTTRERIMARIHGADWRKELKQIARERAHEADLGLTFRVDGKAPATADDAAADQSQQESV